jgi:hypothetical protein
VIAALLEREPAPLEVSPRLERVVRRALAKDPDQRFQTARDLRMALKWAMEPQAESAPKTTRQWRRTAAAILVVGALGSWVVHFRQPAAADRVLRLDISPPEGGRSVVMSNTVGGSALSPDARRVAFVGAVNGKTGLWVRALDETDRRLLPGTEGAGSPFWSPDSKSIGFSAADKLQRTDLAGGPPVTIGDAPFATRGAAWSAEGQIVFGSPVGDFFKFQHRGESPHR